MKLSASFLSIKDDSNIKEKLQILNNTDIDYLHFDIMDGIFVNNKTWDISDIKRLFDFDTKKKDVHLMVSDVEKYILDFLNIKPEIITFHAEATSEIMNMIKLIKKNDVKVGLAINPGTSLKKYIPYLGYVDVVLIMSVNPGLGGQKFITESIDKIKELKKLREKFKFCYLIEIDGGINLNTINLVSDVDIAVVGSFITLSDDYVKAVSEIKKNMDKY